MSPDIRVIGTEPAVLGECPVWSVDEQVLYWVDIEGRKIQRYDPTTDAIVHREMTARPGGLVLTPTPGKMLVGLENSLVWFDWATEAVTPYVTLEPALLPNRLNDGRCDPAGRYVVGTISETEPERTATASVYQVAAGTQTEPVVRQLQTDVTVTNGIAFDPDLARMYFADSPTGQVMVWDYDASTGDRHNGRVFFDYGDIPGKPDGGCVDADGCYWSAAVNGWAMLRITPDGQLDRRIEVPVEKPSMPAFGGADLRTLFVTSIATDDDAGPVPSGSLLALDLDVAGRPEPVFRV